MSSLKSRVENLEQKMQTGELDVDCILIVPESARLDAKPDNSEISRLTCDNVTYDRMPQEPEEAFVMRVAKAAKALLSTPQAVPCLLALTENMLAEAV